MVLICTQLRCAHLLLMLIHVSHCALLTLLLLLPSEHLSAITLNCHRLRVVLSVGPDPKRRIIDAIIIDQL